MQLKKKFKKTQKNPRIINRCLFNKDAIWLKSEVQDKWKQVKITGLWYFYIKALMEDRFDNSRAVIGNNKKSIDLDLIDKSRKKIYWDIKKR